MPDPIPNSCGAAGTAQDLHEALVGSVDFSVPDPDFSGADYQLPDKTNNPAYDSIDKPDITDVTEKVIDGAGTFDIIMSSLSNHLEKEHNAKRISGREYSEAYVAALQTALAQSMQFVLGKDSSYWQSVTAQAAARRAEIDAIIAKVNLENVKQEYSALRINAKTASAEYAQRLMQLSLMDQDYCLKIKENVALGKDIETKEFQIAEMLPLEKSQLETAIASSTEDVKTKVYQNTEILPLEKAGMTLVNAGRGTENSIKSFELSTLLPLDKTRKTTENSILAANLANKTYENTQLQPLEKTHKESVIEALRAEITAQTYSTANLLPLEKEQKSLVNDKITKEMEGMAIDNQVKEADLEQMLPLRIEMLNSQKETAEVERQVAQYNLANILPAQLSLTKEQAEQVRAATMDTRSDGVDVAGTVGTQKGLVRQQIESFQRDAEMKAAKMFLDAWITQHTINDLIEAPDSLLNASVDTVMNHIKANNGLD